MTLNTLLTLIDSLSLEELEELRRHIEARHQQLMISLEVDAFGEGQLREGLSEDELDNAVRLMKPLYRIQDEE